VDFVLSPFAGYQASQQAPGAPLPGAHWWLNRPPAGQSARPWADAPADTFAALGHWGQALYVVPSEGLVVVRFADDRDGRFSHNQLLALVRAAFTTAQERP
jgi:CubicO group peptidase (beta-lactamase class C family)